MTRTPKPWEGDGPCKDCGGRNFPWRSPPELWESVMGCEPGAGGIVCAQCFVKRAYAKGLRDYTWFMVPVPVSMDPEVPLRGRVAPTYQRFAGPPTEVVRQWYAAFLDCRGNWARWVPEEGVPISAPFWGASEASGAPLASAAPDIPCTDPVSPSLDADPLYEHRQGNLPPRGKRGSLLQNRCGTRARMAPFVRIWSACRNAISAPLLTRVYMALLSAQGWQCFANAHVPAG